MFCDDEDNDGNDDGDLIKVLKIVLNSMKRHSRMLHLLLVMQGLSKVKVEKRIKVKVMETSSLIRGTLSSLLLYLS